MNGTFSSKIAKKPSTAVVSRKIEGSCNRKKKLSPPRNPLRERNVIYSSSNSNCSEDSSLSIEAPRGCLRFFRSQHSSSSSSSSSGSNRKTPIGRPKTISKIPKSAPIARASKLSKSRASKENKMSKSTVEENTNRSIVQKAHKLKKNPPCLYQWQSSKNSRSRIEKMLGSSSVPKNSGDSANKLGNRSEGKGPVGAFGEATELKRWEADAACTPLSKTASGRGLNCEASTVMEEGSNRSDTKTPPALVSVSPEIQCGTSVVSNTITPACYGAGHIVCGVVDKRKCRPRGILAVEGNDSSFGKVKPFDSFDDDNDDEGNIMGNVDDSIVIPEPAEASMHWLLSPCDENDEDHETSENGSCKFRSLEGSAIRHSSSSPSPGHGFSSHVCNNSNTTTTCNSRRRRSNSLISPDGLPELEGLPIMSSPHARPGWEAVTLRDSKVNRYDLEGENSPFSMDSLSGGNVMRTPQSDPSSGRLGDLSWLNEDIYKKDHFESEINSVAEVLRLTSLSPNNHESIVDPVDSSFHFDCLTTCSNSVDLTHFLKVLVERDSWLSNSTSDNVSQSQTRISWREGLVSRIYEMDEFDCCRCLSDEEEDANDCSDEQLKSHQSAEGNVELAGDPVIPNKPTSTEFVDHVPTIDRKGKEQFPSQIRHSCAESISTDGDGLVTSRDSDWMVCYKNGLFEL